jgi:hypothetical protein
LKGGPDERNGPIALQLSQLAIRLHEGGIDVQKATDALVTGLKGGVEEREGPLFGAIAELGNRIREASKGIPLSPLGPSLQLAHADATKTAAQATQQATTQLLKLFQTKGGSPFGEFMTKVNPLLTKLTFRALTPAEIAAQQAKTSGPVVHPGAVQVNNTFAPGTTATDAAAISTSVQDAVDTALRQVIDELGVR